MDIQQGFFFQGKYSGRSLEEDEATGEPRTLNLQSYY